MTQFDDKLANQDIEVCYLDDQDKLCRKSFSNVEAAREFAAGNKKAFLVWDQRVC